MSQTDLFPCRSIPDDPGSQKLIGLYRQAQEGMWLQRVKIRGGRLTAGQWRALAAIATRLTPDTPLHLTTRQDIEIHDLTAEQVPLAQAALHEAGLTCFGAAGDTFRNITVCPCAGTAPDTVELMDVAEKIQVALAAVDGIYNLPRKFKISLSCSERCGQPWINCLGFVTTQRGGVWGFRVIGAGSLGARPATGMLLRDWLAAADLLPMTVAAVEVFAEHGDRKNRRKARLRHVRERMTDAAFAELVDKAFDAAQARTSWPSVHLTETTDPFGAKVTLTFANGDVSPAAAEALAELADEDDYRVRIENHHRVIVFGRDDDTLRTRLAGQQALADAVKLRSRVVACPGKRWCSRAVVHTNGMADRIRAELGEKLPPEAAVCISGCPNGCAHPAVADFGLSGCVVTKDGQKREGFNLFAGGGCGRDGRLAQPIAKKLTADEIIDEIARRLEGEV